MSQTTLRQITYLEESGGAPSPVSATVVVHVRPGHEDEFLRLLHPLLDAMRHEPTFINATLQRDPDDPTRFMIYETWADQRGLIEVQLQRDYRKAYLDRLPAILCGERQITVWRPMRSDFTLPTGEARERR